MSGATNWRRMLGAALLALVGACSPNATPARETYTVVTTVGMITDIVREVAGARAEVQGIIGEGVDPHLYKPTAANVKSLMAADMVFYNGLHLEGKMGDVLARVGERKPTAAVTEQIPESYLLTKAGMQGAHDPHVWMDVSAWKRAVEAVADALKEYDVEHAAEYGRNAAAYLEQLDELDAYVHDVIGSIPARQRVLITAHDAFNYFGRAYSVEVMGIQGISTESEAGLKRINELVDLLVERQVGAVFVETSVSEKNIRALIEGAAARGHEVHVGGTLFSDAMGTPGTYEGTYIGMIDSNATTIARALGGAAPERGMRSALQAKE